MIKKDNTKAYLTTLDNPRMTEKAVLGGEKGIYVFNIEKKATKKDVAEAVSFIYKVTPIKVRVAMVPSKKTWGKGGIGKTASGKKAYVTLKKGQKIEL